MNAGIKVSIVDDHPMVISGLTNMLQPFKNIEVVSHFFNGKDLMTGLDQHLPDVILMDIGLPEMNGHETARRIRDQPGGKNILLIAVTGYGQEEDRRRSLDAGFDYHLVKPLNFAELKNKLSELRAVPEKPRRFLTRAKTR